MKAFVYEYCLWVYHDIHLATQLTMNLLTASRNHNESITCIPNSLWIYYILFHHLFSECTVNWLSISQFHKIFREFTMIHYLFRESHLNSPWIHYLYRELWWLRLLQWIHYLFCELTINSLSHVLVKLNGIFKIGQ